MPTRKLKNHNYVYERISSDGRLTAYQVRIRTTGFPDFVKSFDDLAEADAKVIQVLNDRNNDSRRDYRAAELKSLGDVIDAAIRTIGADTTRKGRGEDVCRLWASRRNNSGLCATPMAFISHEDWEDWKNDRLDVPIA